MSKNDEIKKTLIESVKNIFSSEDYKKYLDLMVKLSKTNNYSANNLCLIAAQKPDATRVCSFTTWKKEFNRVVSKGEKGIMIIAPRKKIVENLDTKNLPYYIADYKELSDGRYEIMWFGKGYVFDESQTKGDPIPKQTLINELEYDVRDYIEIQDALMDISPAPIKFENIPSSAKGAYYPGKNEIIIQEGMSQAQTLKTMIHEIAHATFKHDTKDDDFDRETAEVQALYSCFLNVD